MKSQRPEERPRTKHSPPSQRTPAVNQDEMGKKLRRRIEDRLRKDREALRLVARILNIE